MKNNYEIKKSNYFEKPFPYIVKDNFLDVSLLNDINKNWPEDDYFFDEIEGIRLLDLGYSVKRNRIISTLKQLLKRDLYSLKNRKFLWGKNKSFWLNFFDNEIPKINEAIYYCFQESLSAKFGVNTIPELAMVNLMQSNKNFNGHGIHTHHYHNPNWTFTMLLYIDDQEEANAPGTDIYSISEKQNISNVDELTNFALKNRIITNPEGLLSKKKTIEFRKNRLFAFMDTPISYHGVTHSKALNNTPNKKQNRKIIRFHAKYDKSYVKKLYGFDIDRYLTLRTQFDVNNNDHQSQNLLETENMIYEGIKKELKSIFKI